MEQSRIRRMMKAVLYFTVFLITESICTGRLGMKNVYAAYMIGGDIKASSLIAGKDYDLSKDTVLTIDASVQIGKLYTGLHALTIRGSADKLLTVSEIHSASGGTSADWVMESGCVNVEYYISSSSPDVQNGIYSTGRFRMTGGTLNVLMYPAEALRVVHSIGVESFQMSGGELTIEAPISGDDGLHIFGKGTSQISGGTLYIDAPRYGIDISQGALSISGGNIQTEGGTAVDGIGIYGTTGSNLTVSGGCVIAKGGSIGILCPNVQMTGTANVEAYAWQRGVGTGIGIESTGALSLDGKAVLYAEGYKKAVVANAAKGGITMSANHYFVKPVTGAISTPAARGESGTTVFIALSTAAISTPATEVLIDYVGHSSEGGGSTEGGTSGSGSKTEEEILKPLDPKESDSLKDPTKTGEISEATVNALPQSDQIPAVDAAKFALQGNIPKKRLTVHFAKVAGATNYIISWKRAVAKYWTYATCGNADRFVLKGLKRGALLDIRIAAYKDGHRGPWSDISRCFYEKASAKVLRRGKKLTVTFKKVKGATGYQLQWADNKQMDGAQIRSVRKKTKLVLKNLARSRKYFIRWCPFKTFRGKRYIGLYSKVKRV